VDRRHRRFSWVLEEAPQQTYRAQLNGNAQTVVISAVFGDEHAVRIIEMKMPGELIVRRFAREASVSSILVFRKKANWHP
jgi:hypothetical protein